MHETPFGDCLLSLTEKGICGLAFVSPDGPQAAIADTKEKWSRARLVENPRLIGPVVDRIFARRRRSGAPGLTLFLNGTNFQIKVWEALLRIPEGHMVSYRDVALLVGRPEATRAVAGAAAIG
jgi:AraC family transcriptional regulator of adaptative response/methylated-DNA-[protein]-cysteine methyltransferase